MGFGCGWVVGVSGDGLLRVGGGCQCIGAFVTVGGFRPYKVHVLCP